MTDRITGTKPKTGSSFNWQHAVVLVFGLLVFVLLLLADKTHLTGKEKPLAQMAAPPEQTAPEPTAIAEPPAYTGNAETQRLMDAASAASAPVDTVMAAVEALVIEGRPDLASSLAQMMVDKDSSVKNLLVLGALCRNALEMGWVIESEPTYSAFAQRAISALSSAEVLDPKDESVKIELGLSLVQSKEQQNSMKGIFKLREVLELNPRNVEAAYQLGLLSMDTGQFDKAEGRFRSVLEIEPAYLPARYSLALCLEQLGRTEEARAEMKALTIQQDYPDLAQAASQWISKH